MPTRLPYSSVPEIGSWFQRRSSCCAIRRRRSRAIATIPKTAYSAIADAYTPELFVTITPRSASSRLAKLSMPAPVEWIQRSLGMRSASSRNESGPS